MNTSFLEGINWLAVLVGGLGYFALGAIWYSFLFSKQWIKATGVDVNDPKMKEGVAATFGGSAVLMILTALGIAILANRLELTACWMSGLKLGSVTGLLLGATAISISYLYEKRPLALYLINGGYTLLGNIVAAIIICCWR
jgi:nitrate reductase gamma subunit